MNGDGLLMMSEKERERAAVIKAIVHGEMTQATAARRLRRATVVVSAISDYNGCQVAEVRNPLWRAEQPRQRCTL